MRDPDVVVLLFMSGKLMCTHAVNEKSLRRCGEAHERINTERIINQPIVCRLALGESYGKNFLEEN
ncbi:MAG: hypothetical protein FGF48_06755 [Candidatus Brockarchaeota archaeon]|nr:hypothetical protein [Candidatus Brockarchaeota archaeon]